MNTNNKLNGPKVKNNADSQTASEKSVETLGPWNIVCQRYDGSWQLIAKMKTMSEVIRGRDAIKDRHGTEGLRICDAGGLRHIVERTSTGRFFLIPDVDMFEENNGHLPPVVLNERTTKTGDGTDTDV